MTLEIARRLGQDGVTWETVVVEEDTGGGIPDPSGEPDGDVLTVSSGAAVWSPGGGSQPLSVVTVPIANADVLALPTTPVTILASQGVDTVIVPVHATLRLAWTADYTGIDPTARLDLQLGSSIAAGRLDNTTGGVADLLAGGDPSIASLPALGRIGAVGSYLLGMSGNFDSDVADKPLKLVAVNALDFTGGDPANVLTVTVIYYVVTF